MLIYITKGFIKGFNVFYFASSLDSPTFQSPSYRSEDLVDHNVFHFIIKIAAT